MGILAEIRRTPGRLVLVGEAPGPRTDADCPMYPHPPGSAGGRLCALLGMGLSDYFRSFDRVNLVPVYAERWDGVLARRHAENLTGGLLRGRRCLLLGVRVAAAFWGREAPLPARATWWTIYGRMSHADVAWLPHPSGRNRQWNDPAVATEVRAFVLGELGRTVDEAGERVA